MQRNTLTALPGEVLMMIGSTITSRDLYQLAQTDRNARYWINHSSFWSDRTRQVLPEATFQRSDERELLRNRYVSVIRCFAENNLLKSLGFTQLEEILLGQFGALIKYLSSPERIRRQKQELILQVLEFICLMECDEKIINGVLQLVKSEELMTESDLLIQSGYILFQWAAGKNHFNLVDSLIELAGDKLDDMIESGNNISKIWPVEVLGDQYRARYRAIILAAKNGHETMADKLMTLGSAQTEFVGGGHVWKACHAAACFGRKKVLTKLLGMIHADTVQVAMPRERILLLRLSITQMAADGRIDILDILMDECVGLDCFVKEVLIEKGLSAFNVAIVNRYLPFALALLQYGESYKLNIDEMLSDAKVQHQRISGHIVSTLGRELVLAGYAGRREGLVILGIIARLQRSRSVALRELMCLWLVGKFAATVRDGKVDKIDQQVKTLKNYDCKIGELVAQNKFCLLNLAIDSLKTEMLSKLLDLAHRRIDASLAQSLFIRAMKADHVDAMNVLASSVRFGVLQVRSAKSLVSICRLIEITGNKMLPVSFYRNILSVGCEGYSTEMMECVIDKFYEQGVDLVRLMRTDGLFERLCKSGHGVIFAKIISALLMDGDENVRRSFDVYFFDAISFGRDDTFYAMTQVALAHEISLSALVEQAFFTNVVRNCLRNVIVDRDFEGLKNLRNLVFLADSLHLPVLEWLEQNRTLGNVITQEESLRLNAHINEFIRQVLDLQSERRQIGGMRP